MKNVQISGSLPEDTDMSMALSFSQRGHKQVE